MWSSTLDLGTFKVFYLTRLFFQLLVAVPYFCTFRPRNSDNFIAATLGSSTIPSNFYLSPSHFCNYSNINMTLISFWDSENMPDSSYPPQPKHKTNILTYLGASQFQEDRAVMLGSSSGSCYTWSYLSLTEKNNTALCSFWLVFGTTWWTLRRFSFHNLLCSELVLHL